MAIGRRGIGYAKEFWRELSTDDVSDFAAGLSYRFLLALFPFFLFVTALAGVISRFLNVENPSGELLDRFGDTLPSDARSVIDTQLAGVLGEQQPGLLSIGLVGALWAASGGMGATMKAMNRVYDVEETRPFWRRTLLAVGLTLLTGAFFVGAFVLAVAGQAIAQAIADAVGLGDFARAAMFGARYLLALGLLLLAVAFLYWAAPNAKLPFRWMSPGAVMFAIVWFIATIAFGWYVSNFGSYNATYGALGGVVILMIWFYLTAYILLAGAELNAMLAKRQAPEEVRAPKPETDERERSGRAAPAPR
jgi:membrane protein